MTRSLSRWGAATVAAALAAAAFAAPAATSAGATAPRTMKPASALQHRLLRLRHRSGSPGRTSGAQSDLNWAGYAKTGAGFTTSTASWTVPTLSTKHKGYSSTWVGIDGYSDQYLIQTGTEGDVVQGRASYDAWWEVITPSDEAPEVRFNLTVKPGDSITATVGKGGGSTWTMTLKDNTAKTSASHSASYSGPGTSAEWIQEDTDVNGYISTAPDWHSVTFTNITVNGANPALTYAESIDIVDTRGTQETSTSAPNGTANGFTTTWLATGTRTPA